MTDHVLMDNDIVLKACCYDLVNEVIDCPARGTWKVHVLGVVQYVLAKTIAKKKSITNKEQAVDRLAQLLRSVELIEPSNDEILLAADFEEVAQTSGLELDGGESQLLAVLIRRSAALLLTGDKRAIRAIEPVLEALDLIEQVARRVACLEQIAMTLVEYHGAEKIHQRVCGEAAIDKSLAVCFSCASGCCNLESIREGLASYITDLRRYSPRVLINTNDLSTMTT